MFGPGVGIIEDPATGSANGPLACYLAKYMSKGGKLISEQGFEMGRPSYITISASIDSNGNFIEVTIAGQSVFTGEGYFYIR
jgi:trans-2,3-dihydro-3-hydroxyanthranilate isomerase